MLSCLTRNQIFRCSLLPLSLMCECWIVKFTARCLLLCGTQESTGVSAFTPTWGDKCLSFQKVYHRAINKNQQCWKKNLLLLECIHTVPWDWNRRVISYRNSIKLHLRLFVVKSLQLHLFLWHSFSVLECCKFLKTKCLRVNETTNYANTITINLIWCWANFSVRLMAQIKQSDYLLNSAEPFLVAEIVC